MCVRVRETKTADHARRSDPIKGSGRGVRPSPISTACRASRLTPTVPGGRLSPSRKAYGFQIRLSGRLQHGQRLPRASSMVAGVAVGGTIGATGPVGDETFADGWRLGTVRRIRHRCLATLSSAFPGVMANGHRRRRPELYQPLTGRGLPALKSEWTRRFCLENSPAPTAAMTLSKVWTVSRDRPSRERPDDEARRRRRRGPLPVRDRARAVDPEVAPTCRRRCRTSEAQGCPSQVKVWLTHTDDRSAPASVQAPVSCARPTDVPFTRAPRGGPST